MNPERSSKGDHRLFSLSLWILFVSFLALPCTAASEPLTIQEGLSLVTSQGYEMRAARAMQAAAERGEDLARARYRPRVTAYADHTWLQDQPSAVFGTGSQPLSDDNFLRFGVNVNQLITDFGQTGSRIDAARAGARGQAMETEQVRNTAALNLVMAYVELLQAQRALTLADLEVKRFESHVQEAMALHEAGEVTLNDTLAAEVALADARLRRITAGDRRNLANNRLNYLILRPLSSTAEVVEFPAVLARIPDVEKTAPMALANRPEIKALDERISAKEAQLSSSEAERYPAFFVRGGYAYEENSYREPQDNWSATLGLTWDLYTGGARSSAQKQIMDELTALIAQREQLRELVLLEIRDSHRLLKGAIERITVSEKAVAQADESLRLQRARYKEGEATATEVTDAVTSLAQAEENQWASAYLRLQAEARLLYASGQDLAAVYADAGGGAAQVKTGEEK